jgi:hypothetical protein
MKVGDFNDQGASAGVEMKAYPRFLCGPGRGEGKVAEISGLRKDMMVRYRSYKGNTSISLTVKARLG